MELRSVTFSRLCVRRPGQEIRQKTAEQQKNMRQLLPHVYSLESLALLNPEFYFTTGLSTSTLSFS